MHNYNNFHAQKESVARQKNYSIGFQTAQPKKKKKKKKKLRARIFGGWQIDTE